VFLWLVETSDILIIYDAYDDDDYESESYYSSSSSIYGSSETEENVYTHGEFIDYDYGYESIGINTNLIYSLLLYFAVESGLQGLA